MILGLLLALACGLAALLLYRRRHSPLAHLPTPDGDSLLFGHILKIMNTKWSEQLFEPQLSWVRALGDRGLIRYSGFLQQPKVIVTDPAVLKHVLVTNVRNYPKPPTLVEPLIENVGVGLLTSEGDVHARQRRLITPAFKFEALRDIALTIDRHAAGLVRRWLRTAGERLDGKGELSRYTLDVIGETAFSYEFNSLEQGESPVAKAYADLLPAFSLSTVLKRLPLFARLPLETNRRDQRARKLVRGVVGSIIEARLASPDQAGDDLLGLMLASHEDGRQTQDELLAQLMTFLVAGHETTSTALGWALALLHEQPHVVARIREEMAAAGVAPGERPMTLDDVKRLPYLAATIEEVMRLRPPAPITTRQAKEADEFVLSDGSRQHIPKGTPVFILPGVLHRWERLWARPEEFLPERFMEGTPEAAADKALRGTRAAAFVYLPFLAGERRCIGARFALMELQITLAHIIACCDVEVVDAPRPQLRLTLQPDGLGLVVSGRS